MTFRRWLFSTRVRIVALISCAIAISFLVFVVSGSRLIIEDKATSIYEFQLGRLIEISDRIELRISESVALSRLLANSNENPVKSIESLEKSASELGIRRVSVLKPINKRQYAILRNFGMAVDTGETQNQLDQLGWTPEAVSRKGVLVGSALAGMLPVATEALLPDGSIGAAFFTLSLDAGSVAGEAADSALLLFDSRGKLLWRLGTNGGAIHLAQLEGVVAEWLRTDPRSGARSLMAGDREFIAGFRHVAQDQLILVSLAPKEIAFHAAQVLAKKVFILGFAIWLIASGVALLLVRGLVVRLRKMRFATQEVSQGNFSFRVSDDSVWNDELKDLAQSFDTMSG